MQLRTKSALAAIALATVSVPVALGQDWVGDTSQDFNTASNWSGDAFPAGINTFINVDASGNYPVLSADAAFVPNDLFIGSGQGGRTGNGQLDHNAGTLSTGTNTWMFVGNDGQNGTYNMSGSSSLSAGTLNVGAWTAPGATGVVNVDTTGTLDLYSQEARGGFGRSPLLIGENGATGTFNLTNGTVLSRGNTIIGAGSPDGVAANGTLNMTGGTLTLTDESDAGDADGIFGELRIGDGGATGAVNQSAGTVTTSSWMAIGRSGTGTYNLSGGTVNASQDTGFLTVGSFGDGTGTFNITGGTYNAGSGASASAISAIVGESGAGTVNLSGGSFNATANVHFGANDGAAGVFNVIGSDATADFGGDLLIGLNGDGVDTTALGTLSFTADADGVSTVNVAGEVNLSSADGDFLIVDLTSYTGPYADILLVDGSSVSGEFTGLVQGSVVPTGGTDVYTIDYTGGDVYLRAVPEPASLGLIGLAGLALVRRRR